MFEGGGVLLFWFSNKPSNVIVMFTLGRAISGKAVVNTPQENPFLKHKLLIAGCRHEVCPPRRAFLPSLAVNLGLTVVCFLGLTHELSVVVVVVVVNFDLELVTDSQVQKQHQEHPCSHLPALPMGMSHPRTYYMGTTRKPTLAQHGSWEHRCHQDFTSLGIHSLSFVGNIFVNNPMTFSSMYRFI